MRKRNIEKALAKAAEAIDGIAYRLNSPSTNGLTDWLVLFPSGICVFVDLKATRKKRRILQQKRAKQLSALGFPVLCIDRKLQMEQKFDVLKSWYSGQQLHERIEVQRACKEATGYLHQTDAHEPEPSENENDSSDDNLAL